MTVLQEILEMKREEVSKRSSEQALHLATNIPACLGFTARIQSAQFPAIIAEVKRASPSKGIICKDFDPLRIASDYIAAGATAMSVLTDEQYFQGSMEYLKLIKEQFPSIPVLQKDFIISEFQLQEARAIGADAILLIVAALEEVLLKQLFTKAIALGLDVIVEVHNHSELEKALPLFNQGVLKRALLGINNRNLHTFETSLETFRSLATKAQGPSLIAESGIRTAEDIRFLRQSGAQGYLIGESLLASGNAKQNLEAIIRGARQ